MQSAQADFEFQNGVSTPFGGQNATGALSGWTQRDNLLSGGQVPVEVGTAPADRVEFKRAGPDNYALLTGQGRVYFREQAGLARAVGLGEECAVWGDDLAPADEARSLLHAHPVARDHKDPVLP